MKKFLFICMVAVLAVVVVVMRRRAGTPTVMKVPTRIAVSVLPVVASNIETFVAATGNAEAFEDVLVSAQIAEKVLAIMVNEGDALTTGQVIADLDVQEARAALDAASRTVDSVESGLGEASASLTNTARNFERVKNLKAQNVIGQQQYDESETAMKISQSRATLAAALLNQARAKERELGVRVNRSTVRAPFDGVVAERRLDPGAYVMPGTPIVRLAKVDPIVVKAQLPETQCGSVRLGCPARVTLSSTETIEMTGTVTRVYPVVDAAWRTQSIEIACPNEARRARPGMFARVQIITGAEQALLVPDVAVMRLPGSGLTHVYIACTGVAARVNVTVTRPLGAYMVVRGALEAGQDVIVKGQQRMQTGMAIDTVRTEMLP